MRKLREWTARFFGMFNKPRNDRQLDEELESHLQFHIEDNLRLGMSPEEARRDAMVKLGGIESAKEAYRDQRGLPFLDTLWQDFSFGIRMLRKYPGFTGVAVLTLALGIGANTSLFTALDTLMFRPLGVPNPDRLVLFANRDDQDFSFPFYDRLHRTIGSLSGCAAAQYRAPHREFSVGNDEPESVSAQSVSGNFFTTLGVPAFLGRTLIDEDDRSGAAQPVVTISHGLWKRRFGSDPAIVGRSIRLDNVPVTVVGVMPPRFIGFQPDVAPDIWLPIQLISQIETNRGGNILGEGVSWLIVFGRLRDGVNRKQAQAEASVFFRHELEEGIVRRGILSAGERARILSRALELQPGRAGYVGARSKFSQPLVVLMAAVGIVLLIACANIAALLLARGAARQRELAVRAALGAGRRRIIRQLITESILLALAGGALGLLLARFGTEFLSDFLAQSRDPIPLAIDDRALLFNLAMSFAAAALFGLVPAWRLSRLDLVSSIKNQSNTLAGGSRATAQRLLVIAQVALTTLLLAGATLFARTLWNLRSLDFGFEPANVLALSVDPGPSWRRTGNPETLMRRVVTTLETLPGIHSVSIGGAGMLTGNGISMDVDVEGYQPAVDEEMKTSAVLAGPRFFETLRVPLLRGREFTREDEIAGGATEPPTHATVAILGETMAHKYFGDSDPVGKFFAVNSKEKVRLEIVGVAKDTMYSPNLRAAPPVEFYLPFFGSGIRMPPTFYLRGERDAAGLVPEIRRLLKQIEPQSTIRELRSMDEVIDLLLLRERIIAQLIGFFGTFGLFLACLGLYGTLSFQVAQRTREIGVRIAMGATIRSVVGLVTRQAFTLVFWGGLFGIAASLATTRFVASFLYGVTPTDPTTFACVIAVFIAAAGLASWLPSQRAARVDPMIALRYE